MLKWLVLLLVVSWGTSPVAQEARIGKGPRSCTAEELKSRESELPAALPVEPKAAAEVISTVLGCNARPLLVPNPSRRSSKRNSRLPPVVSRPISPLNSLFGDRQTVTFQSQPEGAEIWIDKTRTGVTAGDYGVRLSALPTTVFKKEGFQDCSFGEWTETRADRVTVFCALTPETQTEASRFAVYRSVDFYGSDVARMRVETLEQCLSACLGHSQCHAITLNTDPQIAGGHNCFLKSDRGRTVFYEQAISVLLLQPGEDDALMIGSQRVLPAEVRPRE